MGLFSYSKGSIVQEKVKVSKDALHIYHILLRFGSFNTNAYVLKAGCLTCCATLRTRGNVEANCVTGEMF